MVKKDNEVFSSPRRLSGWYNMWFYKYIHLLRSSSLALRLALRRGLRSQSCRCGDGSSHTNRSNYAICNIKPNNMENNLISHKLVSLHRRRTHIHAGYRPRMSLRNTIRSLRYVHNQTENVYTHLVGACLWALLPLHALHQPFAHHLTLGDVIVCGAFYVGTLLMLVISAAYHLFECAGQSSNVDCTLVT